MYKKITLLAFNAGIIPDDSTSTQHPAPDGVTSVVLAGGVPDLRQRYAGVHFEEGFSPIDMPTLAESPDWLMSEMMWSLTGQDGRMYIAVHKAYGLENWDHAFGVKLPALHGDDADFLLKCYSKEDLVSHPDWYLSFFCAGMGGEIYIFSGDVYRVEQQLRSAPDVFFSEPRPMEGGGYFLGPDLALNHYPELHNAVYGGRILEVLDELSLLILPHGPYGGENFDALVLTRHHTPDQLFSRLCSALPSEVEFITFHENEAYEAWQTGRLDF